SPARFCPHSTGRARDRVDLISLIPNLGSLSVSAVIVVLFVLALMRGDIVPRKSHEEAVALLREALKLERDAHGRTAGALHSLLTEHGATTDKVLTSLPVPDTEGATE